MSLIGYTTILVSDLLITPPGPWGHGGTVRGSQLSEWSGGLMQGEGDGERHCQAYSHILSSVQISLPGARSGDVMKNVAFRKNLGEKGQINDLV